MKCKKNDNFITSLLALKPFISILTSLQELKTLKQYKGKREYSYLMPNIQGKVSIFQNCDGYCRLFVVIYFHF